mmetsp:Transcript_2663/g.2539  ORF Transcript_2663/g.2539 Transcript_2663/m.2539 type:complete len:81 (-) Transcript_2663:12-254(-)
MEIHHQQLQAKLATLMGFATRSKMPDKLVFNIRKFIENNNFDQDLNHEEHNKLISQLPASLRGEVIRIIYAKVLTQVKFF